MSALFDTATPKEKTVLIVDVENGSVGSGLVRLSDTELPKLFAQHRVALPILKSVSSAAIAKNIERAIEETLRYTSKVAAHIRQNEPLADMGTVEHARLFFGPPWTTAAQLGDRLQWSFEPSVVEGVRSSIQNTFADVPSILHPFSRAAVHAVNVFFEGSHLLCTITGEVTELLLIEDGKIQGRATLPVGVNTTLRTLKTHGDMSFPEAQSALRLYLQSLDGTRHLQLPLESAAQHFCELFVDAAKDLMKLRQIRSILVLAGSEGEWFARALTKHESVTRLFPNGGTTKEIRTKHLTPFLSSHATLPDLHLLVAALFTHSHDPALNGI